MDREMLELALKQISNLEKRVEKYYTMLQIENELDFILQGNHILDEELQNILTGNY